MTNFELVEKAKLALSCKTLYVNGAFGAPLTKANKKRYTSNTAYNKKPERTAKINSATEDTFGFDCIGLIKGCIWGFDANKNDVYGGAKYCSNGVPDISEDALILKCNPSTNFKNIVPGAVVWLKGHIGIYIGDNLVIESSPAWKDGVQITNLGNNVAYRPGYNTRVWTKWGKLPYIDYMTQRPLEIKDKRTGKKITIEDNYVINDKNYTGVRELLEKLGFEVGYEATTKLVTVDD